MSDEDKAFKTVGDCAELNMREGCDRIIADLQRSKAVAVGICANTTGGPVDWGKMNRTTFSLPIPDGSLSLMAPATKRPCIRIAKAFSEMPWAILPDKLELIADLIEARAIRGEAIDFPDAAARPQVAMSGAVAVLPIHGTISHRANMLTSMSGGASTEQLGREIDSMASNPNIASIVLDIESPGGSVAGVQELGAKIKAAAGQKPVIAVANGMAASAAYWLASQASEIVVTPSGQVGSIGVVMMHQDISRAADAQGVTTSFIHAGKYKVEGNEFSPLENEARANLQAMVDSYYSDFVAAVAKGRGVGVAEVRDGFGQGRMVRAKAAVEARMADRVGTLDDVINEQMAGYSKRKRRERMAAQARASLRLAELSA
jgi:signal peptide peptidase SppA